MRFTQILLTAVLWSSAFQALAESSFVVLPAEYARSQGVIELANMPRYRSQDSFGLCAGFSAATVVQFYLCKAQRLANCAEVAPEKEISSLYMMSLANPDDPARAGGPYEGNNYNINFKEGNAPMALRNWSYHSRSAPESCAPFDQIASRFQNKVEAEAAIQRARVGFQRAHCAKMDPKAAVGNRVCQEFLKDTCRRGNSADSLRDTLCPSLLKETCLKLSADQAARDPYCRAVLGSSTEATACFECEMNGLAKTFKDDFNIQLNAHDTVLSLQTDSFESFMYGPFIAQCSDPSIENRPRASFNTYPTAGHTVTQAQSIAKIKEILGKGYPLQMSNVCGQFENGKCLINHALVISGYRRQCKSECSPGAECCRDVLKVHDSSGAEWQSQMDGGWVDAATLMHTEKIPENALSWLLPKE